MIAEILKRAMSPTKIVTSTSSYLARKPLIVVLSSVVMATVIFNLALYSTTIAADPYHPYNKELHFTVYTTNADQQTIDILKKYYTGGTSQNYYVIDDTRGKRLFPYFLGSKQMVIGTSIEELRTTKLSEANVHSFRSDDVIAYDIEIWPATPLQEQINAADAISEASKVVHQAGYKFGVTPDSRILLRWYDIINWKEVDFLGVQFQGFTDEPELLAERVRTVSDHIKSVSPETQIFVQVSFRITDVDDMKKAVAAVQSNVDGIIVGYVPDGRIPCRYCSPENLDAILFFIDNIKNI